MNFIQPFCFFAFSISSCLLSAPINFSYESLLAELDGMKLSELNLIDSFNSIKFFYKKVQHLVNEPDDENFDLISKFSLVLDDYHAIVCKSYSEAPKECLQFVRLYGNVEFIYFFNFLIGEDKNPSFYDYRYRLKRLTRPVDIEVKWSKLRYSIISGYTHIFKVILQKPFKNSVQNNNNDNCNQYSSGEEPYDAIADWNKRKDILEEIILSLKSLYRMSIRFKCDKSDRIKDKIAKYKFIVEKFQVGSEGPSYDHFLSIYYQLCNLSG